MTPFPYIKLILSLAFVWLFPWQSCEQVFVNYDKERPVSDIAQVRGDGLRLYLIGAQKKLHDRLDLSPGEYMIGFRQNLSRLTGATHCKLAAGQSYTIELSGRVFLKQSKTWSLTGECVARGPIEP